MASQGRRLGLQIPERLWKASLPVLKQTLVVALVAVAVARASAEEPGSFLVSDEPPPVDQESLVEQESFEEGDFQEDSIHREASFQPESPRAVPRRRTVEAEMPAVSSELSAALFGGGGANASLLSPRRRTYATGLGVDFVSGYEAVTRSSTDLGNLLGKSPSSVGVGIQQRTPVVTDLRVRGSRVGSLAGSGSYWVPARMDLDTVLSKIDSRIISDAITVKGPYAARYGPGFAHVDFDLLKSPRYSDRFHAYGSTAFDYKANGDGWYGQQMLWGGSPDWGFRASYGHRTGNDYTSGGGVGVPSSYNSRTFDLALGRDLSSDRHVEFNYLRLDQTGVELPGQAFDIDMLYTDGYELEYIVEDPSYCDWLELDLWYNRTRFDGSAQRSGKRLQFPYYVEIGFTGQTDVDSMSTGFRLASTWGSPECESLTAGIDLRYLKQELNEITSSNTWANANSPIPRSYQANPGLFVEYGVPVHERVDITAGARVDLVSYDMLDDPATLVSTQFLPLGDVLGSDDFTRTEALWAAYVTGEYEINGCWTAQAAVGYAERPPSLTELYAAETVMFVLQNGLNAVTGDPRLKRERLCQTDFGIRFDTGYLRGGVGGFYAWAWDYVTYEAMAAALNASGQIEQVLLKYVNTDLATLAGVEAHGELDLNDWLSSFATLSYVEGMDRTRNGDFATRPSTGPPAPGPSTRDYSRPRGFFSGISGDAVEPLPGIVPLESRLGIRIHQPSDVPVWSMEISARLVATPQSA